MALKIHQSIAASVVILFVVTVVVVESTSNYGKLKLRPLDILPAAHNPSLLSASSGASSSGELNIIYEDGIVIETVLDENRLDISIYSTLAVPSKDFLYAVDSTASQLLKIRLPIDQSTGADVARRIAGDRKGRTGYNDGWGEDALLDHPKGLAIDGDGNVYVADVRNHVIRKISPGGYVTTLAGQPNKTGHVDGEGRTALFSSDFTLTYLPRSCSLLISDRGNGRLRIIQLKNPPLKCVQEGISSDHLWKNVTYLFGVLVTILSAALGIVQYQKAELQQRIFASLALDDEGESSLNRHHNGGASKFPYLMTRPRLSESAATHRRARSLPDDVSDSSDLMDFSDSPGDEEERNQPRNRLENSAFGRSGDAENDAAFSNEEDGGTSTPDNRRIRSEIQELLSDPDSMLTGHDDSFSRHLQTNSALVAPDRTISLQDAINRLYDRL